MVMEESQQESRGGLIYVSEQRAAPNQVKVPGHRQLSEIPTRLFRDDRKGALTERQRFGIYVRNSYIGVRKPCL